MKEIKINIPDCCDKVEVLSYPSGVLRALIPYKEYERCGAAKWYYENGNLQMEVPFKDGKEDGVEKWYNLNGDLERECTYKDGVLISEKEIK